MVVGPRLTQKQIGLLLWANAQRGRRTLQSILEWAEYTVGIGYFESLESIPMSAMDALLAQLRREGVSFD